MKKVKKQSIIIIVLLLLVLIAGGVLAYNTMYFKTYDNTGDNENAILVDGDTQTLHNVSVTKSGNSESEQADFHGTNSAILAQNGGKLDIKNSKISTDGNYANGVFAYGDNSVINIENTKIKTTKDHSGGIMTTGGATMNAKHLQIETFGNSSAAIRSDRGGGNVNVDGGTYISNGIGSPAVYSTADIVVSNATLNATKSEAIVIERGDAVTLNNCTVTGNNEVLNSQSQVKTNIMIYHSMPDASNSYSEFTSTDSTIESKVGPMFYVTNTTTKINLTNTNFILDNNQFLAIEKGPWGADKKNGGNVALTTNNQKIEGDITVDSISALNLILSKDSSLTGKIESKGKTYVKLSKGATWKLTGDSSISSLTCSDGAIDLNGYKLLVNGKEYTGGDSKGKSIEIAYDASMNKQESIDENRGDGENPPSKPPGEGNDSSIPEKPVDENGNPLPPPDTPY